MTAAGATGNGLGTSLPSARAGQPVRIAVSVIALFGLLAAMAAIQAPTLSRHGTPSFDITNPANLAEVTLPLTVQWTVDDTLAQQLAAEQVFFAVFVDRAPVAPGQNLYELADDECRSVPGCPDAAWLAEHDVLVTNQTSVTVEALPPRSGGGRGAQASPHEVTVVLMSAEGPRLDPTGRTLRFFVADGAG